MEREQTCTKSPQSQQATISICLNKPILSNVLPFLLLLCLRCHLLYNVKGQRGTLTWFLGVQKLRFAVSGVLLLSTQLLALSWSLRLTSAVGKLEVHQSSLRYHNDISETS